MGIAAAKDRIVQTALKFVMEPIFEREFLQTSYGFRRGRGCKDALGEVDRLLQDGYTFVLDADLKSLSPTASLDGVQRLGIFVQEPSLGLVGHIRALLGVA